MKKYFAFVTILIIIVFIFTGTENNQQTSASTHPLFTVQCKNTSVPYFKLGYDANPSEEEIVALCNCIWDTFLEREKDTAIKLASGKKDKISAVHMAGFASIFGKRISECGGEKL